MQEGRIQGEKLRTENYVGCGSCATMPVMRFLG